MNSFASLSSAAWHNVCGTAEKFLSFKGCQLLANGYGLTPLCRVLQSAASLLL